MSNAPNQLAQADERILRVIYSAIDELNLQLPPERRVPRTGSAPLLGDGSTLDSLGVVNLIVEVEQRILNEFGASVLLAEDLALFEPGGPLTTVRTLRAHIVGLLTS